MSCSKEPPRTAVDGLQAFGEAKEGARRFHREALGEVDPDHCWGDFLLRLFKRDHRGLEKSYQAQRTKTAMGESVGLTGGYTVPTELRYDLMRDVGEESIFRPRALVVPMKSNTLLLPLPDAVTVPAAAGISPFYGGIKLNWTPEGAARTETEPLFREVTLRVHDLAGYCLASNDLLQDGEKLGLDAVLRRLFARSIAFYEDLAFFRGTGVGQPQGIVTAPAAKAVTRQTASQFTIQDVGKMSAALLPSSWSHAIWAQSPTVWQYTSALTGWQVNMPYGPEPLAPDFNINGRPGYTTEKLPALGTAGDVVFFDPSLYVIGDRGEVDVAFSRDEPTAFFKNQGVFRLLSRVDGQPWLAGPVTLQDGATVVSSIVVLT